MNTDWLLLWRELVRSNAGIPSNEQIKRYKKHAAQKQERPDPLLDFVLNAIDSSTTVLEIGPGSGRWTIPIGKKAGTITAIDPSRDMLEMLKENARVAGVEVRIVQSTWEEAQVNNSDIVVCAHSMYNSPDLNQFVRKMEQHARKACYMSIRLPPADGIIGELTKSIYGRIYDSPNAIIAFNALYSMRIYPNVLVESDILPWTNDSLEDAFIRVKKHLHLEVDNSHDDLINKVIKERLVFSDGRYVWPDGMRSVLFWWQPSSRIK